jgi:hypothetical protein
MPAATSTTLAELLGVTGGDHRLRDFEKVTLYKTRQHSKMPR